MLSTGRGFPVRVPRKPYARLDDAALAHLRERYAVAHHSNAIEGIHPTPELAALMAMFLEERVPWQSQIRS